VPYIADQHRIAFDPSDLTHRLASPALAEGYRLLRAVLVFMFELTRSED
jgi:hypothetical protein